MSRRVLSKYRVYGAIVFVLGWSLSACQHTNSKAGQGDEIHPHHSVKNRMAEAESKSADSLIYFYDRHLLTSDFDFPDSAAMDGSTYYQLDFPRFEDPVLQDFISLVQLGTDTIDMVAASRQFIEEYEAYQINMPYPRIWTYETSTKVQHITPFYVGLKSDHYSYTGGAHGSYAFWFSHYWLPTHEVLEFKDLVDTNQLDELTNVAMPYFWDQERLNHPEMEPDLYFFQDEKFHLPENISLEKDSVLFLYNIYEIKPYVYGHTELRLPYSAVKSYLTDKARKIVEEINK